MKSGVPRGKRHRERAAHWAQLTRQRELAQEHGILRERIDFARSREDGQQDRQVVGRAGFFGIRRGEVDRQPGNRPVVGAGFGGRAHALARLGDRAGRQADHIQPRQAAGQKTLDRDDVSVNAAQPGGKNARYHPNPTSQLHLYFYTILYYRGFRNVKQKMKNNCNIKENGTKNVSHCGISVKTREFVTKMSY